MKSLNKTSLILLLFIIALNKTFCIKSSDFCGLKQKLDECQGLFSYKCGSDVCAKNITDCNLFLQMNSYLKKPTRQMMTNYKLLQVHRIKRKLIVI